MVHALAEFVQQRAKAKGWGSTEFAKQSGLSKQLCNTWMKDERERVTRLPEPATIAGFKKAFGVSTEFLLGKAIESLDIGYSSGDFINSVTTASDRELLDEIEGRLAKRGEGHAGPAATNVAPESPEPTEPDLKDISDRQLRRIIREAGEQQYESEIAARASAELERRLKADRQESAGEDNQDPGHQEPA